jgi:hypothetical protein
VIRAPDSTATTYGPAIQETDPRYGVEAALSLRCPFSTSSFSSKNDRATNNQFFGGTPSRPGYRRFPDTVDKRAAFGSD